MSEIKDGGTGIPEWVKVGQEVVHMPRSFNYYWGEVTKITKVHKDGKFKVENGTLFTPSKWGNKTRAREAGTYGRAIVAPFTGADRTEAEFSWKVRDAKRKISVFIDKLSKAHNHYNNQQIIDLAASLPEIEAKP